jgi:hypothetical protein
MEDIGRRWRKSSYSGNGGECVEVGHARDVIAVRDTSQDQAGPVLRFSPAAWLSYDIEDSSTRVADLRRGIFIVNPRPT